MNKDQENFLKELTNMKFTGLISSKEFYNLKRRYLNYISLKNSDLENKKEYQILPKPISVAAKNRKPVDNENKKRDFNLAMLLIAGISLILISAIIWIVSTWKITNDYTKVISMVIFDIAFFVSSFIALKYLKLKSTAYAFWNLGVLIIPIIFVAIWSFELLGIYLSANGDGSYLFLGFAFTLFMPILIYTLNRFKSSLYLIFSIINTFWIVLAFSKQLQFNFDVAVLGWNLVVLGLVLGSWSVKKYSNKLTETYNVATEVLVYFVFFMLSFDSYAMSLSMIIGLFLSIAIVILLYCFTKKTRFSIIIIFFSYFSLYRCYDYIFHQELNEGLYQELPTLIVVSLMMIPTLILMKKSYFKYANAINTFMALVILSFNSFFTLLSSLYTKEYSFYTTIFLYMILAIVSVYIYVSKSEKELKVIARTAIFPIFLLANISIYGLFIQYEFTNILKYYLYSYHFFVSSALTIILYLLIKFKNEDIFVVASIFNIIALVIMIALLPNWLGSNNTFISLIVNLIYLFGFILQGFIMFKICNIKKHRTLLHTLTLITAVITMVLALEYSVNEYGISLGAHKIILLWLLIGAVFAGMFKTIFRKALNYTGIGVSLFATFYISLSINNYTGNFVLLASYLILVILLYNNLKRIGLKNLSDLILILFYVTPFLNVAFYTGSKIFYYIFIGILFYSINLFDSFRSLKVVEDKLTYKGHRNTNMTYISYGLILILMIKSIIDKTVYIEMTAITLLIPLTFMLLEYNELKIDLKRIWKAAAIFSVLIPYWYFINIFEINSTYLLSFWVIPVIIVGILIYYLPFKDIKDSKLYLSLFVGVPIAILLIQYLISGNLANGVILIVLTLALIIGGFLVQNFALFIDGIIGLTLNIFIIIYHYWENSPWWVYLLISGLILVFVAGYKEYAKVKSNKENIEMPL